MATLKIPARNEIVQEPSAITEYLAKVGVQYRRCKPSRPVAPGVAAEEILEAYNAEIEALSKEGGYVTADVIDVTPSTPDLDQMLNRFNKEHWHDEDEVRFIVEGNGVFHFHPPGGDVVALEVEAGDLIRVPRGSHHWFDLCANRRIRAIRLFQDKAGWTPHYTETGVDQGYIPSCFGAQSVAPESSKNIFADQARAQE